jgi:hypothetical protein
MERLFLFILLLSSGLATSVVGAAESPLARWGTVDEKSGS